MNKNNINSLQPWSFKSPFELFLDELARFEQSFLSLSHRSTDSVRFSQTADGYHVEIDLPGVRKEDLKVSVVDNMVYITAQRKVTQKGGTVTEDISRSFLVPKTVDLDKSEVKLEHGILTFTAPTKEPKIKQRLLEVK